MWTIFELPNLTGLGRAELIEIIQRQVTHINNINELLREGLYLPGYICKQCKGWNGTAAGRKPCRFCDYS